MNAFRFEYPGRFAELSHDAPEIRQELLEFFDSRVRAGYHDEAITAGQQGMSACHVTYEVDMQLWRDLYHIVKRLAEECHVLINWEQIKHVIKFTFLRLDPGGVFVPHVNYNLLALSAFNIPLKGKTEIGFYSDDKKLLKNHEYFNPCFLNVNRLHGVVNDTDEERLILKTHLTVVPWKKLLRTYTHGERFQLFPEPVPWENLEGQW